jgi:dihydropteroate synthase
MTTKSSEINTKEYSVKGKIITFGEPLVMGIVNITPDSFYDGGKYGTDQDVLNDVEEKVKQGAQIIDIGAASSRPGAKEIDTETEWQRLYPALSRIRNNFPAIWISVDTWRAEIAKRAAAEGADIVNDIGGGTLDPEMFHTIAKLHLPYVLMHIQGDPQTMQINPSYASVVTDIKRIFLEKIKMLEQIGHRQIIIDPGFGFGKDLEHNYSLLKHLEEFAELGYPVLAGLSRKGMINKVIGTNPVTALNGTTVLNTIALLNGASILRVHDVAEAKQAIRLVKYYQNSK